MALRMAVSAEPAPSVPMSRSAVKPAIRSSRAARRAWIVRRGTDSCTVCKSSAPGCKNRCTCASINPGSSVLSPRSITSAVAGCFTAEPTSTIRSPSTSTSPGFSMRPFFTSSRPAACRTISGEGVACGCVWAEAIALGSAANSRDKDRDNRDQPGLIIWLVGDGSTSDEEKIPGNAAYAPESCGLQLRRAFDDDHLRLSLRLGKVFDGEQLTAPLDD